MQLQRITYIIWNAGVYAGNKLSAEPPFPYSLPVHAFLLGALQRLSLMTYNVR